MKIAILISGQPRNYKKGYLELKKWFLDKYDCDLYIHTWKDINVPQGGGHNFNNSKTYLYKEIDFQNILNFFQPKDYIFQESITFDASKIENKLGFKLNSILSAYYSFQQSFKLLEKSQQNYDLIIKTRFDLQFSNYISPKCIFLKNLNEVNFNALNFFDYDKDSKKVRLCEIDDLFAVGTFETLKIYSTIYSWIIYYLYEDSEYKFWIDNNIKDPIYMAPELFLKWHMLKNNVTLNPIDSLSNYWAPHIIR
jgi:hypothetical protein